MKNKVRFFSLTAACVVSLLSNGCRNSSKTNGQAVQSVNVRIEVVTPQPLIDNLEVAGIVKAYEDVNMSPEEGGVVKEWKVVKGQKVAKGDLVVVLKDDMLKAGWNAAEAQYKIANLNLDMQRKVYEEKGISELQFKNLQYARDAAKANADLMKARWEHTQLRSPIDGVVDNTIPNVGDFAPPGMPIARIVNTSIVKIQSDVPELYSGSIHPATKATVSFDALPGDTLKGEVSFVGATVSSSNRSLPVEIILPNPSRTIKPEMVAKVRLQREAKASAIMVSDNVVQLVDRDRVIAYVENNGKAEERRLRLGGHQGIMVEVLDGLKPGDHLIVSGYQKVVDNSPVVVTQ